MIGFVRGHIAFLAAALAVIVAVEVLDILPCPGEISIWHLAQAEETPAPDTGPSRTPPAAGAQQADDSAFPDCLCQILYVSTTAAVSSWICLDPATAAMPCPPVPPSPTLAPPSPVPLA